MFDIGFSELVVIGIVALVVIGPERLPRVARMAGHLLGRMQRYVNDVKADINREIQLDELRKLRDDVQDTARNLEMNIRNEVRAVESAVSEHVQAAKSALDELAASSAAAAAPVSAATPQAEPGPSALANEATTETSVTVDSGAGADDQPAAKV